MKMVSVIVPSRNEAPYIEKCIRSILAQDYPAGLMEVIVADGMSEDGTFEIMERLCQANSSLKVVRNPRKTVPHGLNVAIGQCRGDVIVRMDVHAVYPESYVRTLVNALEIHQADNVGVPWVTAPGDDSLQAHAIAFCLSHVFGVGMARYRLGISEPTEVDTVPFGCFRREVFQKLGLFDEELHRNQDDEFNGRMKKAGMRILLLPGPAVTYFARESISKCARMLYQYGLFKPLVNIKLGAPATLRQLVPPAFVLSLLAAVLGSFWTRYALIVLAIPLGLHILISILIAGTFLASPRETIRKPAGILFPVVFLLNHLAYGWGYLLGICQLPLRKRGARIPASTR